MNVDARWLLFVAIVAFSFYWTANVLLWLPWSINPTLGMVLMLSLAPFLWGLAVYLCMVRYTGEKLVRGAIYTSLVLLGMAVVMDYLFFGLIRGAMDELYHPTTLYGYGFLLALPFLGILFFKNLLQRKKREANHQDFIRVGSLGLISFLLVMAFAILNVDI